MALGEPGAGEYILITDYSKDAIGAILHQVQPGATRYIGAKGRKCQGYEKKITIALYYGLKNSADF